LSKRAEEDEQSRERMWGEKGEKGPTERLEGRESKNKIKAVFLK